MPGLLETLDEALPHPPVEVTLLVPYGREDLIARLYRNAEVLATVHEDEGTVVHARVGLRDLAAVREFVRTERRGGRLSLTRAGVRAPTGRRPAHGADDHRVRILGARLREPQGQHLQPHGERDLRQQRAAAARARAGR